MWTSSPARSATSSRRTSVRFTNEPHVRAQAVLLVDHAEADPREAAVEIDEQLGERRALRLDLLALIGVGEERRRDPDLHAASSAASTEWISGR